MSRPCQQVEAAVEQQQAAESMMGMMQPEGMLMIGNGGGYGVPASMGYGMPPQGYAAPAYGAPGYGAPAYGAPGYGMGGDSVLVLNLN